MNTRLFVGIMAVMAAIAPATAQQRAHEPLEIVAVNLTASEDGRADDVALPGDMLEYRLTFTNLTQGAVKNVTFNNPVPEAVSYVAESANADVPTVRVDFSIDGGESYSELPLIEVEEGGRVVQRPAPAGQYTHVRWTVLGDVLPGTRVTAVFRAKLGGAQE